MISLIFDRVLYVSFMGTIAAILILVCRFITKSRAGIKFQYAADFILIIRLLMFCGITTSISIYNYVPSYNTTIMNIPYDAESISDTQTSIQKIVQNNIISSENLAADIIDVCAYIWITGIIIMCLVMVMCILKANKQIKKAGIIDDKEIVEIFNKSKKKSGINRNIKLIKSDFVKSPCVYGYIEPKLLVPESLLDYKKEINFEYIFLHELVHIKRKHILINYIIFVLNSIHWFNPLIRYSLNKMKEDVEIMCDSEVLSILDKNENIQYGNLLLDLQKISIRAPWLPQMAGIINNKNKMERRITMIKKFKKSSYSKLSIIALTGIILMGGAVLTEAKAANVDVPKEQRIEDKLDYSFVNDEEVVGKWEAVDFVEDESDFKPGTKSWEGDLYLKDLIFLNDGKMAQPIAEDIKSNETKPVKWLKWTKGIVMHSGDKTASSYKIKEIDGEKYMIYQWKSGDYIFRGEKPWYYVLKQVK